MESRANELVEPKPQVDLAAKSLDTAFLGHPRGLATLFFTEMWERFSYYGMRAILLFYMYFSVSKGGLGMDPAIAASVMSIYGSLVYLSGVVGGFMSDRLLGSRKTVFIGGILIMIGHVILSIPFGKVALFTSIGFIIIGTGLLKPNVSEMVGGLYAEGDYRRDSAFNIFVFGINVGSFLAPLAVGFLGQEVNFHLGFSLAGVGMFFGLLQYYFDGKKYLPKDSLYPTDPIEPSDLKVIYRKAGIAAVVLALILVIMKIFNLLTLEGVITLVTIIAVAIPAYYFVIMLTSRKITSEERSHVWAYLLLFIASVLFWSIEEQGSVVLAFFAQQQTRLTVFGHDFPSSWFQSANPLFIMIYVPIFTALWTKLGKRQPSSPAKFAYGLFFAGVSFLWMMLPALLFGTDVKVSPFWLLMSWGLVIVGEMLISPIGLAVTTKLAPKVFQAQMMSVWFLGDAVAQALNAQIVRLYSKETEVMYFGVVGAVTITFGIFLLFMVPKLKKLMGNVN